MDFMIFGNSITPSRCMSLLCLCRLGVFLVMTNFGETSTMVWFYAFDCFGNFVIRVATLWIL